MIHLRGLAFVALVSTLALQPAWAHARRDPGTPASETAYTRLPPSGDESAAEAPTTLLASAPEADGPAPEAGAPSAEPQLVSQDPRPEGTETRRLAPPPEELRQLNRLAAQERVRLSLRVEDPPVAAPGPAAAASDPAPPAPPAAAPLTAPPVPAPEPAPAAHVPAVGPVEQSVIESLNARRAALGLPPLVADAALMAIAAQRSQDMVNRGYRSHYTPEGTTVFDLIDARGVRAPYAGENLGWGAAPEVLIGMWMESPTHRDNVLEGHYTRIGVSVVGTVLTAVFAGG